MLELFQNVEVRYLVRDTQQYSMLLMTLGHPDLLTEDTIRNKVLWNALEKGIGDGERGRWILEQERKELLYGDVPYFYYYTDKKQLHSGTGDNLEEYFDCPVMEYIERRLRQMCYADMERQQKLIRSVLLMGTKKVGQNTEVVRWKWNKEDIFEADFTRQKLEAAEKIAGILFRETVWTEGKKEVGWISIIIAGIWEKGYMMRPMDDYLYGGIAGVTVFMAELVKKTGKEEYRNMYRILVDSLFRHTDNLFRQENMEMLATGAYVGEASIAYAYMLLYSIGQEAVFLQYLWKQCQVSEKWLAEDREYDVLGGNAGAIMVFLKAYHLTGKGQYMIWARKAGDHLIHSATKYEYGMGWINQAAGRALTGFAHGAAGIMLALARLGHDTQEDKYLEAAYQAFLYEEHYYREEILDWEDLRKDEHAFLQESGMAWCHGWGGITMARMEAAKYVKGDFKEKLEKIYGFVVKKVAKEECGINIFEKQDFSLCHGRCGNQVLFAKFGVKSELLQAQMDAEKEKDRIVRIISQSTYNDIENILGLQECCNYGLMSGITGVGYSCICDLDKIYDMLCIK